MVGRAELVVALLIAVVLAITAVAGLSFASDSSRSAQPASGLDDPAIQSDARRSIAAARQRQAARAGADRLADRTLSRARYRGVSDREAFTIARDRFPALIDKPAFTPFRPDADQRVEKYFDGSQSALIAAANGTETIVESTLPLRGTTDTGVEQPVDMVLAEQGSGFAPVASPVRSSFPKDLADGYTLPYEGGSIVIHPTGASAAGPPKADGDKLFYANVDTDTDLVAAALPTGAEISDVLRSPDSPETLAFDFDRLPAGAQLRTILDGHAAEVVRGDEQLALIRPPVAVDADGEALPVSLAVDGQRLALTVSHRSADVAYPVLVDPEIFTWNGTINNDFNGWTYNFIPEPGSPAHVAGLSNSRTGTLNGATSAGLYTMTNGQKLYHTDQGVDRFQAPGDAYVYRADFNGVQVSDPPATIPMCSTAGIFNNVAGAFDSPYWLECSVQRPGPGISVGECAAGGGTYPNCSSAVGAAGNEARFSYWAYGDAVRSAWLYYKYFSGAVVYLGDRVNPTIQWSGATPPSGWTNSVGSFAIQAQDGGLGVKTLSITSSAAGWAGASIPVTCSGTRGDRAAGRCANPAPLGFSLADLPDGAQTIHASATDTVGNQSSPLDYPVKLDRREPTIHTSGDLDTADPSSAIPTDTPLLSINATDMSSAGEATAGVQSIKIQIDGADPDTTHPYTSGNTWSQGSPCDTCSLQHDFTINTSSYGAGDHTVDVWATDFAGNQAHQVWTFTIDRTSPKPYCSDTSADPDNCQPDPATSSPPTCSGAPAQTPSGGSVVTASAAVSTTQQTNASSVAASDSTTIEGLTVAPAVSSFPQPFTGYSGTNSMVASNIGPTVPAFAVGASDQFTCLAPSTLSAAAQPGQLVAGTALEYANTAPSTDTILRPTPMGVQQMQQIRDSAAPVTQTYQVAVQGNQYLQTLDDGSIALIDPSLPATPDSAPPAGTTTTSDTAGADTTGQDTGPAAGSDTATQADYEPGDLTGLTPTDSDIAPSATDFQWQSESRWVDQGKVDGAGQAIAVITPPTARDASGVDVPASAAITGPNTFNVTTQHTAGGYAYPVLASLKVAAASKNHKHPVTYGWSGGYGVNFSANNGPPGDPNTDGTDRVRRKLKMPYRTAGDVRTNPPTARHVMFFQNSCNKYDAAYGTPRNPNLNPDLGSYSDPENLPLPGPDASDAEKADWRRCKESARTVHQALKEQLTPYVTLEPDPGTCGVRGTDIDRARQYARSVWRLEHYAVFSNVKFWGPTNESDHGTKSCPTPKLAADFAAQVWEELKQYNRTPGAGCQPAPDVPSHPVGCHLVAGEFSNDTKFAVQGTPGSEDYNKAYIKHMKDNKDKVHVFALHDYYDVIFNNTAKYYPASRSNPSQSFVQVREFGKLIKDKYPGAKIWLSEQGVLLTGKGQGLQVDGQHQIDAANRFLEIGQEDPRVNLVNYYEFFGCSQDPSKRRNCNTNFDSGLVRNPPDPPNPEIQRPPYSFGGFRAAYCRLAQRPKNTCYQGPGL